MKTCIKCKVTLSLDKFGPHKRSKDRLKYWCRPCEAAGVKATSDSEAKNQYNRDYYAANRTKERKRTRLRRYGLTQEQFDALWADQAGGCAICEQALLDIDDYESGNSRPANACCIDHCHTTGKIRGLLCIPCNLMLGYAKDSTDTLAKGIKYLTIQLGHVTA